MHININYIDIIKKNVNALIKNYILYDYMLITIIIIEFIFIRPYIIKLF